MRSLASLFRRPPVGVARATPYRYVLIVTYARSGSTLLQKILAGIDGFHVVGENHDALGGLYRSYLSARATREEEGSARRDEPGDPWRGAHHVDPERYARALARVFVDEILQPPPAARVVGFKEVRYFDCLDVLPDYLAFIQRVLSPSLVVFNKRKATDVARSAWWKEHPTDALVTEVERFDTLMDDYTAAHPHDAMVVDYDAYRSDPTALRPLFDRLDVTFEPQRIADVLAIRLRH
jgi:hypothetical protein